MINPESSAADDSSDRLIVREQRRHDRIACCPKQGAQRHDFVAARVQPVENSRQSLNGLRTVASSVMQQDDATIAPLLFDSLDNNVRAGLRPILGIDVFQ